MRWVKAKQKAIPARVLVKIRARISLLIDCADIELQVTFGLSETNLELRRRTKTDQ